MPAHNEETVLIPKWFIWFLSAMLTMISAGGLPWAIYVSNKIAQIETQVAKNAEIRNESMTVLNRRLDRLEDAFDRMGGRGAASK